MFKNINSQFIISYLGFLPFLIIIIDRFFVNYFSENIVDDFIIFYALIIFVFIGAINWNLKKRISNTLVVIGFIPSFLSVFIILMFLNSLNVSLIIIIALIFQLLLDYFIYKKSYEKKIYFSLRVPLTILIVLTLLIT
tara:strand:+ start:275 stop:688 length:414 start_codon:yes stop_codon:yes gene_type:complete